MEGETVTDPVRILLRRKLLLHIAARRLVEEFAVLIVGVAAVGDVSE